MNFKKFALLILTVVAISGFYAKPVSASANDNVTTIQTAETVKVDSEVSEDVEKVSADLAVDENENAADLENIASENAVATPSPKSTPAAQKVAKATAKTAAKSASKTSYSKSDLRLMASIINCEAGAEGFRETGSRHCCYEPCGF